MKCTTIPSFLRHHAAQRGHLPAYFAKADGAWRATCWSDLDEQVRQATRALIALSVRTDDKIGILGSNRPEWTIAALGSMAAGGAPAGIYATCPPPQVGYILEHAQCPVVIVENGEQYQKVRQTRSRLPSLAHVVLMEGEAPAGDPSVLAWKDFMARGDEVPEEVLDARLAAIEPGQTATLIYTSGTTGLPKAAMLSHANLVETARICLEVFGENPDYCTVSYLPLAHIAEQMFSIHIPVSFGFPVYYAESLEKMPENLRQVEPTIFFGVPRVWERVYAALNERVDESSWLERSLFRWAIRVGRPDGAAGGIQRRLAERFVASRVRRRLGLGRAQVCISGGAPIALKILEFFAAVGIEIYEIYGQSEAGPVTWNRPGRNRLGTVGPPLPGIEVRIAEDGEILVRGPNVFRGYLNDAAATAEAIVDGWLHSGDLGVFDDDGFLIVTGRKKEILITSGGKNIAPAGIERAIEGIELVEHAVVAGDRQPYLTALLTLDPKAVERLAAERRLEATELCDHPEVIATLERRIEEVNRDFARPENIRKFRVLPTRLTIEANELTPTMKVKRHVVYEKHADLIESMYSGP